ncbi:mechanosensitive ion channel family protein [Vibrio sp. S17_S38]|uniref:mechanosensitive ion channel family protein n=1 Tax=Vibrio sp. S17_S38 TaxID=2720229 RepID=UPI001680375F|nr:mechanosensitive ion channel family protein [Vibrio sp. S17_S38]MBD1573395.1 mechanosensitive ion channel family protein [Vibrio sp. S17_S38]
MLTFFKDLLTRYDIEHSQFIHVVEALGLIVLISIVIHIVLHRGVLVWIKYRIDKSKITWRYVLFRGKLFNHIALLIQGIVIAIQTNLWLSADSAFRDVILTVVGLWIIWFAMLSLFSLLNVVDTALNRTQIGRDMPIRGIIQSIKIIVFIVASFLFASVLFGKSPLILLSGFGAMTAVFMLVFKDPILGFVAGVQLSANKMLSVGDWLEMPKYGADGDVIDISLTTVKVQNWDKTITTIPAYALISDSFKNWKGMTESGGRRIKRSVLIDATSVHFINQEETLSLGKAHFLETYIKTKTEEVSVYNKQNNIDDTSLINGRRLTNIGSFRAYLEHYLLAHSHIRKDMTLMVRQLPPTHEGISIEIYCFTDTTVWVEYERIQSDIFDHLYAVLPEFKLNIAQAPTGSDFRSWNESKHSK